MKKKLIEFTPEQIIAVLISNDISVKQDHPESIIITCPFHKKTEHEIEISKSTLQFHCAQKNIQNHFLNLIQHKYNCSFNAALKIAAHNLEISLPVTKEDISNLSAGTDLYPNKAIAEMSRLLNLSLIGLWQKEQNYIRQLKSSLQKLGIQDNIIAKFNLGYTNSKKYLATHTSTSEFKALAGTQKIASHLQAMGLLQKNQKLSLRGRIVNTFEENIANKLLIPIKNEEGQISGFYGIKQDKLIETQEYPILRKYIQYKGSEDVSPKTYAILKNNLVIPYDAIIRTRKLIPPVGKYENNKILLFDNPKDKNIIDILGIEAYTASIIQNNKEVKYTIINNQVYDDKNQVVGYSNKDNIHIASYNNIRQYEIFHIPIRSKQSAALCYIYGRHYNENNMASFDPLVLVMDPIQLMQLHNADIRNVLAITLSTAFNNTVKPQRLNKMQEKMQNEQIIQQTGRIIRREYPNRQIILIFPQEYEYFNNIVEAYAGIFKGDLSIVKSNTGQFNKILATGNNQSINRFIGQHILPYNIYLLKEYMLQRMKINPKPIYDQVIPAYKRTKKYFPNPSEFAVAFARLFNVDQQAVYAQVSEYEQFPDLFIVN